MEVLESPTTASQKHRRSTEPMGETEKWGHEYYLLLVLDALEATITPSQWGKQKSMLFENNLAQLESLATMVSL